MVNASLREELANIDPGIIVLNDPSFDNSIIGVANDVQVVYSGSRMIEELIDDEGMSYDDAADFLSYDTMRAIQYLPKERAPIIVEYEFIGGTI